MDILKTCPTCGAFDRYTGMSRWIPYWVTCECVVVYSPCGHFRPPLALECAEASESLIEDALVEALRARALALEQGRGRVRQQRG